MSHPTNEQLMAADITVIDHLESCARCRESLESDIDLDAVWRRVQDELTEPHLVRGADRSGSRRSWTAGAVAAIAVVVLVVPVALFTFTGTDDGTGVGSANTQPSLGPAVQAPEYPPEPVGEDPSVLPAPPDTPAFEMSFSVGDTIRGRLIWARPDFYEAARVTTEEGLTWFEYAIYRTGDGTGFSNPNGSMLEWAFPSGATMESSLNEIGSTPYVPDPDIPWDLLIAGDTGTALKSLGLGDEHSVPATHPLADDAWGDGTNRLESTADGIPVLIERAGEQPLSVETLDRRILFRGEVGNNVDIGVYWALNRAEATTPEQRDALRRGLLTLADYRAAAQAAAECAQVETSFDDITKLYVFPDEAADCVATWVSDIEQVWRLDAQLVTSDEQIAMYYEAMGMPEVVEMYRSEQGPERPLASGDGWAIAVSERGPGYCTRTSVSTQGYGEGCFTPSQMPIPGVLGLDSGWSYTDNEIDRGALLGIVAEEVEGIEVTFSLGEVGTIVPGGLTEFGFRGFGYLYDAGALGVPTRFDVFGLSGPVRTYETGACDPESQLALSMEERAKVCP